MIPIRSLTSIYWVVRDLLRPFFRSSFFRLIAIALVAWYVLTGQAGAILLTDISYDQNAYNPGSYTPIVPGVASIPAGAEYATNFGSSRTPVYVKSNIGRREVYFPFMSNDGSNAGNVSITNSQGFFSLFFSAKNTDFDEVFDFNVGFTFASTNRINENTLGFSLVGNSPLYDQVLFRPRNENGYFNKIMLFDVTRKELYTYNIDSTSVFNLYTNYGLFNYIQNKIPNEKRTGITDMFYNAGRDPCGSIGKTSVIIFWEFYSVPNQYGTTFCADSTATVTTPTEPLNLDTYLNVVLPQTDGSGSFENNALGDYAVCLDYGNKIEQQINNLRNCQTETHLNTYLNRTGSDEYADIMTNYDWYDMTYNPTYTNKHCKAYNILQHQMYNTLLGSGEDSNNRYVYNQTYLKTLNNMSSSSSFSATTYCSENKDLFNSNTIGLTNTEQGFLDSITNFFNGSGFSLSGDNVPSYLKPFQNIKDKYFTIEQYQIIETQNFCLETGGKQYADIFLYGMMITVLMSLFFLLNR